METVHRGLPIGREDAAVHGGRGAPLLQPLDDSDVLIVDLSPEVDYLLSRRGKALAQRLIGRRSARRQRPVQRDQGAVACRSPLISNAVAALALGQGFPAEPEVLTYRIE